MKLKGRALLSLSLSLSRILSLPAVSQSSLSKGSRKPAIFVILGLLIFGAFFSTFSLIPPVKTAHASAEDWIVDNNFDSNITTIDSTASYLNSVIFSTPITNYNGNIYTCYLDLSRNVIVAKSTNNGEIWSKTTVAVGIADDGHDICSIGVDSTGFIHVSYDMHANPLKYKISTAAENISVFQAGTMTGVAETSVTYPHFFMSPSNEMYFLYRQGGSGSGDLYIKKYNTTNKTWSDFAPGFISGTTSTPINNPYEFTLVWDAQENMHLFWNWRNSGVPTTNNNLLYAKYNKNLSRWEKSDGTPYTLPITTNNAEIADTIPISSGLANNGSNYVDTSGRPHAAYTKFAADGHSEIYHTYYNGSNWVTTQATDLNPTISGNAWDLARPQLLIDSSNTIYIFFTDAGISTASNYANPPGTLYWTKSTDSGATWTTPEAANVPKAGEFVYDYTYFRDTGNIRFFYQTTSAAASPLYMLNGTEILNDSYNFASYTNTNSTQAKFGNLQLQDNSGMIGYWKLEESSGNVLNSGINSLIYGTTYGTGVTRRVAGHSGYAYQFGGAGSVKVAYNDLLNFGATNFTLETWFKTSSNGVLIAKFSSGVSPGYLLQVSGGKVNAFIRDGTGVGGSPAEFTDITGGTTVTDNQWHHVAASYDRDGNLALYIDGHSDAIPVPITISDSISNSSNLVIGGRDTDTTYFTGIIDEVAIFNKALSLPELNYSQDYSTPCVACSPGSYTSPYHTWATNEISDSITIDAILNSGTVSATVQVSADKFLTIAESYDITVLDGNNIYNLPLTSNELYVRVLFSLTPANSNSSPVVNSFQVTGELSLPVVTVQAADSITASSAVLYGTITDVGTQNATTRGFKYYQSADCTGTENDRSENGSFGAEAYSLNLTGLAPNTAFSYKSYATSPAGTGISATCEAFTTLPNGGEPTPTPTPSPTATPDSSESATATPAESTTATPAEESTPTHPWWWRLLYGTTGDTSPTDSFTTTPTDLSSIEVGQEITFDASPLGSNITSYEWNFGDGTIANGMKVSHKYGTPGRYTVMLTTTDKSGNKSTYTQIIDIRPAAPTISDIKADGTSIVFEGKSSPETIVDLTIHSIPYSGQAVADKDGEFTYTVEQGSETLGEGDHTVFASATVILSDNSQLTSEDSKTYDFKVSVDDGKLKVEMGKTRIWQYISLGLILIIAIGLVLYRLRKNRKM